MTSTTLHPNEAMIARFIGEQISPEETRKVHTLLCLAGFRFSEASAETIKSEAHYSLLAVRLMAR